MSPSNFLNKEELKVELKACTLHSDVSDSGDSLETPPLDILFKDEDVNLDVAGSLTAFSPISADKVELRHNSAVNAFEEWAALQTPIFSPW